MHKVITLATVQAVIVFLKAGMLLTAAYALNYSAKIVYSSRLPLMLRQTDNIHLARLLPYDYQNDEEMHSPAIVYYVL